MDSLSTAGAGFVSSSSQAVAVSKWDALGHMVFLCTAMFLGAMGAGSCPLALRLPQRQMVVFNSFGSGLLLGTALAVIIPEGVEALYTTEHSEESLHHHEDQHGHHSHSGPSGTVIGWALVLGFIVMLLVDKLGSGMHPHDHSSHADHECESDHLEEVGERPEGGPPDAALELQRKRTTVAVGLLVHSAADGLALGSASAAASPRTSTAQLVVFLAIMMHKVPAAFGLSMYLRSSGLGSAALRRNLALFALSAPVGALVTFLLLHKGFIGLASVSSTNVSFCLLFSGGTFLYVATVHTLGELHGHGEHVMSWQQLAALCAGCVFPLLFAHAHEH